MNYRRRGIKNTGEKQSDLLVVPISLNILHDETRETKHGERKKKIKLHQQQ